MKSVFRLLIISSIVFLIALLPAQAGNIKKWVDENGVTHYGTAVPPQYRDRAHSELNEHGIEVKRHERAKTEEEIERDKALAALRAEQQKLLEEQQARDRILLNLYRNEDDLVMARDGKIAQLDGRSSSITRRSGASRPACPSSSHRGRRRAQRQTVDARSNRPTWKAPSVRSKNRMR